MTELRIRRYDSPAGGWGALEATGKALALQGVPAQGAATLLRMNQPEGFDCPGCAWPDPKHAGPFESCENGAEPGRPSDARNSPPIQKGSTT